VRGFVGLLRGDAGLELRIAALARKLLGACWCGGFGHAHGFVVVRGLGFGVVSLGFPSVRSLVPCEAVVHDETYM